MANAYEISFVEEHIVTLKCLTTPGTLKQSPGRVLQYMFMI